MITSDYDQYTLYECWVEDANGHIIASDTIDDSGWYDDWDRWDERKDAAIDNYMEENFWRLDDVVAELRNM